MTSTDSSIVLDSNSSNNSNNDNNIIICGTVGCGNININNIIIIIYINNITY